MRIGIGYDAHAFDEARSLMLGGVRVDSDAGLSGHSDGDVLCHALADALLGAARLGDLGDNFPPSKEWKDAPGVAILGRVASLLEGKNLSIVNVDCVVIAQAPPLARYRVAMQNAIAQALGVEADLIGVKFTTTDGLGFPGRSEGVAAFAAVLVE